MGVAVPIDRTVKLWFPIVVQVHRRSSSTPYTQTVTGLPEFSSTKTLFLQAAGISKNGTMYHHWNLWASCRGPKRRRWWHQPSVQSNRQSGQVFQILVWGRKRSPPSWTHAISAPSFNSIHALSDISRHVCLLTTWEWTNGRWVSTHLSFWDIGGR